MPLSPRPGSNAAAPGDSVAPVPRWHVCLLCLSVVKDDPRVRKQGNLLHRQGFRVVAVGLLGGSAADPGWPVRGVATPHRRSGIGRALRLARAPQRYGAYLFGKALQPMACWSGKIADRAYWRHPVHRALFEAARGIAADVYVANDWNMLPIARRLARMHDGRLVYDSHEYAAEELPESLLWRIFGKPLAVAVERSCIGEASLVSTVSPGIAAQLQRDYRLREVPLVMRNVPEARPGGRMLSPLGRDADLTMLFHGAITAYRGLHVLVASVRLWRDGLRLILRGPIADAYRRRLERIVRRHGLEQRVAILPPVPADRLIEAAVEADVGVVCLPDTSLENRFALPNKVFEYIGAGLALMVPRLDELQGIVGRYGNGVAFPRLEPGAIAGTVNRLDHAAVNAFKANSRAAAEELVWEREAAGWSERLSRLAPPAG